MKKFDLVFIATFQSLEHIFNLTETIKLNSSLNLLTILVNQTGSFISISNTSFSNFVEINVNKNSLSFCRNVAIDFLLNNKIDFDHIMFPDDDTTFNLAFFHNFKYIVSINHNYLLDVYINGTSELYISNSLRDGSSVSKKQYHIAMSVNMIISKLYFDSVLFFDEKLGVGTSFGSAEDTDYFLRVVNLGTNFIYTKQLFNFHPSSKNKYKKFKLISLINRFINYGNGILYALCKHKMYLAGFLVCIRAIGGSLLSLLRFNLKLSIAYFISFLFRCVLMFKLLINNNV